MSDCGTEAFKPHARMTKSKSQLRAEAVERLRKLNCMDVDCYQLLEATVDDAGEKVGYRVEIRKLIDLLIDDAHESRGSYEERLYDVPVSDCPYCGCKRVVIHDFSDIYENPHSYRVEHIDEKEAFEAGCFETYYSFDSVKKAVEHANMRDLLTDEPMDARRDSDGTCPIDDGTASVAQGDEVTKLDAQSRAEIEDMERSRAVSGDLRQDADVDSTEGGRAAQDTREKLEADVRQYANPEGNTGTLGACWERKMIEFLDRQAAITRAECDKPNWDYCETCEQLKAMQNEIAELKADNDCLRDRNEKLDYEVRDWKGEAKTQRNNFEQATEARKHWQRKYETVKAERDELKSKADALEADKASWQSGYHIDRLAKLQAQRDRYRDLLSKAVDEAQAIVKLMEVES